MLFDTKIPQLLAFRHVLNHNHDAHVNKYLAQLAFVAVMLTVIEFPVHSLHAGFNDNTNVFTIVSIVNVYFPVFVVSQSVNAIVQYHSQL